MRFALILTLLFLGCSVGFRLPLLSYDNSLSSSLECTVCKYFVGKVEDLIKENKTISELEKLAADLCIDLDIELKRVCDGIVKVYGPDVACLSEHSYLSEDTICGVLVGDSCATPTTPSNWTVQLPNNNPPPKYIPLSNPPMNKPTFKVLHIADLHLDPTYLVGSQANCKAPQCCDWLSSASDQIKAKDFATLSNCDIPESSLATMLEEISTYDFDWVYWTGDITPHNVWNQTQEMHVELTNKVNALIKEKLPGKKVFPAIGNHETYPVSQMPFPSVNPQNSPTPAKWIFDTLESNWNSWLNDSSTTATIVKGGYYTTKIAPKLRLISYNGVIADTINFYAYTDVVDPYGQLEWLAQELQKAENAGDYVHIIGHEPPYASQTTVYKDNYYRIIRKYANTVRGQFAAHTHKDEFRVFYEDAVNGKCGTPYGVMYVAPSITTYSDHNPAFKIYTIDGDWENSTWSVLDFQTYVLNLTKVNNFHAQPTFSPLYSAKEAYSLNSLFPQDWSELIYRFSKNNDLFTEFYHYFLRRNSIKLTSSEATSLLNWLSSGVFGTCSP